MSLLAGLALALGVVLLAPARMAPPAGQGATHQSPAVVTAWGGRWLWWVGGALLGGAVGAWTAHPAGAALGLALTVLTGLVGTRVRSRDASADEPGETPSSPALAADLVVACLSAGVPLMDAVDAAGAAVGGSLGRSLRDVRRMSQVGADPDIAVRSLAAEPATARLARAVARAGQTGMSPAEVLAAAAEAERARRRSDRVARARGAGSLAAAPVGLLFLPAFVLVAVVPLVVGSLSVLQP